MDGVTDQQTMVSSFLEIAVGQTPDTARQFLQVPIPFFLVYIHMGICIYMFFLVFILWVIY